MIGVMKINGGWGLLIIEIIFLEISLEFYC